MRATYMFGAGDVRLIDVPAPTLQAPTDAIVRVTLACVCGSDLHPYHSMPASEGGVPIGHEFIGIIEELGSEVTGLSVGDLVISPFAFSDNTCSFCRDGFRTACKHGGWYGNHEVGGAQVEAVGLMPAYEQAYGVVRPGGIISRVGVPQYEEAPIGFGSLFGKNALLAGGPAPVRAYLEDAITQVLDGEITPGQVFDAELPLDDIAEAYRLMDSREALKVIVRP